MKRMKRLCALLMALCMLFTLAPVASAANGTIKMTLNSNTMNVNGTSVKIDTDSAIKPQVKKINGAGYTMLPLRAVVESMGGTVAYDAATKVITMNYGGNTLKHTIGTKTAYVNGVAKSMAIASYAENNRTYVHLRAIELLSSSVKVSWVASAPNDVTISYPRSTSTAKTVALTIKNACETSYLQFTSLQLAPAGTTTYSGNLLNETLYGGKTRTLNMAIQPGKYDLKGTDINGNLFYWKGLDFTNVKASAYLSLTSGSMYTLTVDNTLIGGQNANLTVINNTGAAISKISTFQATSVQMTDIYNGTLYSGSYASVAVPYTGAGAYYYLVVTFANGSQKTYQAPVYVNQSNLTIALNADGITYGGITTGDGVYFVNRTGSKISTLEMKVGKGDWVDVLDGSLKSGDYIIIDEYSPASLRNMDVSFRTRSSGSGKSIEVASALKSSIVFYYGRDLDVRYNVDPDDVSYEEGLYVYNDSNVDFDDFYVVNIDMIDESDYDYNFNSIDDYFEDHDTNDNDYENYDASDFYDDWSNFGDGDLVLTDEWDAEDLAKADLYFLGIDSSNQKYYGSIDVGSSSKFDYNVYVTIEDADYSKSTGDELTLDISYDYSEDDWFESDLETGLLFYNDSSKNIDKIYVSLSDSSPEDSDDNIEITNLDRGEWEQADYYDRWNDIKGETVYYYVDFDGSGDYAGSFSMSSSTKENACIIINGTASSDDRDYDWYDDDYYYDDEVLFLYNDTGFDIERLYIGIGDTRSEAKDDDWKEIEFRNYFDDGSVLVVDESEVDFNDIDDKYVHIWAELRGSSDDFDDTYFESDGEFSDTIALWDSSEDDEEWSYVCLVLEDTNDLEDYYDDDADYYID